MKNKMSWSFISLFGFLIVSFFTLSPTTYAQIYVGNSLGNNITSYGINATGNVAPTTNIQGAAATLNVPYGVAVDANWIYVANHFNNSVDAWPINATGNVAPTRSIAGALTTLNLFFGVAVDANWIYVGNAGNHSVDVWPINATGNVAPTRSIAGGATTLNQPSGVAVLAAVAGAPAPVPTMTEWGMVIFIVLMALVSLVYLKGGRLAGRKAG